jgi:hypothetical protein
LGGNRPCITIAPVKSVISRESGPVSFCSILQHCSEYTPSLVSTLLVISEVDDVLEA